ncbi:hypothetical protein VKT23_019521 [Stygiomarasmius scandens]|uniref:Spt5 transcription elongation factor N-terminal domain-containing protein n=1 Tax=Marasmiellus scandens TaxID=2682957 RepID=A0ABR1IPG0_9AGAR
MPRKKSAFILDEAESDDGEPGPDGEQSDDEDSWDDCWENEDLENSVQGHQQPPSPEAEYRNIRLRDIDVLAEELEQRYVHKSQSSAGILPNPDNQVSNHDLRLWLLGSDGPSNMYRLRCQRGRESNLVMDIAQCLLPSPTAQIPKPPSIPFAPPVSSSSSSEPTREARGWDLVKRFALGILQTLPEMEEHLHKVYGDEYNPSIWQTILSRINDREDDEQLPAILYEIDQCIASSSSHSETCSPLPSSTQLPWRAQNQPLSSSQTESQCWAQSHVYSAFSVPNLLGWIYLEARIGSDLRSWLHRRHDVFHSSNGDIVLEIVSTVEASQMLSTSLSLVQPFTWIRVTRGLYRNDTGLVLA